MHLRCFGVDMHQYYHMKFFFVSLRGASVLAKHINLQIHGFLSKNVCLRLNMTLTARNVSYGTKSSSTIYNKVRD